MRLDRETKGKINRDAYEMARALFEPLRSVMEYEIALGAVRETWSPDGLVMRYANGQFVLERPEE
ncbi:hypothetical protein [Cupriavidus basilensis]|uniref:hypothetical protein n=1 Tax=Cupriavidus basilensis TaxID=68895 RepID=UPI000750EEE2|nr:hypothetical protein [Cupriavidus basilensis]